MSSADVSHDTYSGSNGLLTPFVNVECNCVSTTVLSSHATKFDSDIIELSYRYRDIFHLLYCLSIENSI